MLIGDGMEGEGVDSNYPTALYNVQLCVCESSEGVEKGTERKGEGVKGSREEDVCLHGNRLQPDSPSPLRRCGMARVSPGSDIPKFNPFVPRRKIIID